MRNAWRASLYLVAILSLFWPRPGVAAADSGEVLTFNGHCFVISGGERTALKMRDRVHVGDVIDVPDGAKLKLRMSDGSILALGPGTHLTITAYDPGASGAPRTARLDLANGLLRAIVAKVSGPSTYEIETATGVAAVRATDWFIAADPDKTEVDVLTGLVGFRARNPKGDPVGAGVQVPPDSGSQIDTAATPAVVAPGRRPSPPQSPAPTPPQPVSKARFAALIDRTGVSFGWCQCLSDDTRVHASCESSTEACKAACNGTRYGFLPNARLSCAPSYADVPVPGETKP